MKMSAYHNIVFLIFGTALVSVAISAAPLDIDDEASENYIPGHEDPEVGLRDTLDPMDMAALRKLLLHLNANDDKLTFGRVNRAWPQEPRGWSLRSFDARVMRPWRADKRQVRFRQCYFNPISCFRK